MRIFAMSTHIWRSPFFGQPETICASASSIRILIAAFTQKLWLFITPIVRGGTRRAGLGWMGSACRLLLQCIMPLIQANFRLRAGNRAVIGLDLTA